MGSSSNLDRVVRELAARGAKDGTHALQVFAGLEISC
jgi:hypothetical protein